MTEKKVSKVLQKYFEQWLDAEPSLGGINTSNIFASNMIKAFMNSDMAVIKRLITKNINKAILANHRFKIGKTGAHNTRATVYKAYNRMYLLCESRHSDIIDALEAHYINKYIELPMCGNINRGSANGMTDIHGKYYLYLVVESNLPL